MRSVAAALLTTVGGGLLLVDVASKDFDLARGWTIPLVVVTALSLVVLITTAPPVRRRGLALALRRRGRTVSLELHLPSRSKRELRRRAQAASDGILASLAEYNRTDPARTPWWFGDPQWTQRSKEEQLRMHQEYSTRSSEHLQDLMTRYEREYSVEALALYEEFLARGLADPEDRHWFAWPVNTFGLREVAQKLGMWARQL